MSNRDRIAHLRAEADAAAKEKEVARAVKAARPAAARKSASKAVPPVGRIRLAWNVCDQRGKPVKQFPYAQEQEAHAECERLTQESGRSHFVAKAEVPVD
jgi:hypothetical protein